MKTDIITEHIRARVTVDSGVGTATVRTLRTVPEVEELRSPWMHWQKHPNADIDFFLTICRVRPEIQRPHVLVVYRRGAPEALLVGRIEDTTIDVTFGYSRLGQIRARRLAFNHGGFLGRTTPENGEVLMGEIVRSLKDGAATAALFSHLGADSPLLVMAHRIPGHRSRDYASKFRVQTHRSMTLPMGVDMLYGRFPGKRRKNLKWQAKKLLTDFPNEVRVHTFCDNADLDVMFRDIEEVARQSYQRGLGVGFSDTQEMRNRMALSADKGWLQAHVLYISERPCAFWVGTLYHGVFHSNFMGYDRKLGRYSPGMFLLMKVIEGFCEKGGKGQVSEIDFGLGDAQYKEVLADREWKEGSVSVFAPTWAGLRLSLLLTAPAVFEALAKEALKKITILQRVKKLWRGGLAKKEQVSA